MFNDLDITLEVFTFDKKTTIMCETRICKDCKKELPIDNFPLHKKAYYLASGEKREYMYRVVRCSDCLNEMLLRNAERRIEKDDLEFFNYEKIKCSILKINNKTYKVSTKDIELHYTHYVGFSGDLKMNTNFPYVNASEFIDKTYEHRMLLFKEICKL